MAKKKLILISIASFILTIIWSPFVLAGYIFYLLSKLMRSFGQLLMLNKNSARDELAGFWHVYKSIGDILKN